MKKHNLNDCEQKETLYGIYHDVHTHKFEMCIFQTRVTIYLAQIHVRNLELSSSSHTLPPTKLTLTC